MPAVRCDRINAEISLTLGPDASSGAVSGASVRLAATVGSAAAVSA